MTEASEPGSSPDNLAGGDQRANLSRRQLLRNTGLGAAALGGAALLGGGSAILGATPAAAHGTLLTASQVYGVPLFEQNLDTGAARAHSFEFQPNLYTKLGEWMRFHYINTPLNFQYTAQYGGALCLNGTHVDKPGMHQYGRAADISTLNMWHGDYQFIFDAFNGRYDWWRNSPSMAEYRRRYWGVVCSMNIYFKYVLHYEYDRYHDVKEHYSHVHVDNEASDGVLSTFSTGSESQVKTVQATTNYLFGHNTAIDGVWGPQTNSHSSLVIAASGWSGSITSSQANWHRFLWAGMRVGHGLAFNGAMTLSARQTTKPLPAAMQGS